MPLFWGGTGLPVIRERSAANGRSNIILERAKDAIPNALTELYLCET
jgi:hypothetical protein